MGYCGAPSKGCEICRRRKIRCDRSGTPCNNCVVHKHDDQCTYRNQLDLNFRIVAHSTLAAQVRRDQERRRERKRRRMLSQMGNDGGKLVASAKEPSPSTAGADSSDEASVSSRSSTPDIGAMGTSPTETSTAGPSGAREYKWDYFTAQEWERDEGGGSVPSAGAASGAGNARESMKATTRAPSPVQGRQQQQQKQRRRVHQLQHPQLPGTSEFSATPDWPLASHTEAATQASTSLPKPLYPLQTHQPPPASSGPLSDDGSISTSAPTPATYAMHSAATYRFVNAPADDAAYYPQGAYSDPAPQQGGSYVQPGSSRQQQQQHHHHHHHNPALGSAYPSLPPPSDPMSSNAVPRSSHHLLNAVPTHRRSHSGASASSSSSHSQLYPQLYSHYEQQQQQHHHQQQQQQQPEQMHTCQGGTSSVTEGIEVWGCKACLATGHFAWHVRDGVALYPVKNASGEWGCGQCWAWMARFSENQQLYAALGI